MKYITKELPKEYKNALKGFKKQAYFVSKSLEDKINKGYLKPSEKDKEILLEGQQLMYDNPIATKDIYKILTEENTNIDKLTEDLLFDFLEKKYPYSLSHLTDSPFYFIAYKKIEEKEYYFITQYYNDANFIIETETSYNKAIKSLENLLWFA